MSNSANGANANGGSTSVWTIVGSTSVVLVRVSHHFQASGYGSTGIGTFIFSFTVQTLGETRFTFGSGPFGTLIAPGQVGIHDSSRTFTLTATLADLPADAEASIFLQQTTGSPWRWFQTAVRTPPILDPTIISA